MNNPKIVAALVARQGSSRLPGKALTEVVGKPIIAHIVERLRACKYISDVVIATSTNVEDDAIETLGRKIECRVYRGHPEDILDRIYHAVKENAPAAIVEVGGDCPFISPALLDHGIELFISDPTADVVTNALVPPFTYPVGYDFILVKFAALARAHSFARLASERYQPFQYMITHSEDYVFKNFSLAQNFNHWRWTLDYPEDLEMVDAVYRELYHSNPFFGFAEIKSLIESKPSIASINSKYAEPVQGFTAWFTGSYVKEVHEDISQLLREAFELEEQGKYNELKEVYHKVSALTGDLIARSDAKLNQQ